MARAKKEPQLPTRVSSRIKKKEAEKVKVNEVKKTTPPVIKKRAAPKKQPTALQKAVPKKVTPEKAAPQKAAPKKATPKQAAKNAASKEAAVRKTTPKVIAKKATPKKAPAALQHKGAPPKKITRKKATPKKKAEPKKKDVTVKKIAKVINDEVENIPIITSSARKRWKQKVASPKNDENYDKLKGKIQKVVRDGVECVIKYGRQVTEYEKDAAIFVGENTKIPVPRIVDFYYHNGKNYLVMETVPGENLQDAWPKLKKAQRDKIVGQLKDYMAELFTLSQDLEPVALKAKEKPKAKGKRSTRRTHMVTGSASSADPRNRYVGGYNYTRCQDFYITTKHGNTKGSGPFNSVNDFHQALSLSVKSEAGAWYKKYRTLFTRKVVEMVEHMPSEYTIHFAHGDLHPRNIMVHNGRISAIIDWESCGWYPEYWEFCTMLGYQSFECEEGWMKAKVPEQISLKDYYMELAIFLHIRTLIFEDPIYEDEA